MNRTTIHFRLALLLAIVGWVGLAMQYWLLLGNGHGPLWAAWRFVSYYTLLTNTAVALVATGIVMGSGRFTGPLTQLAVLAAILQVGIVYSLMLRATHHPHGMSAIANHIVHDFAPLAFLLLWLLGPHGKLKWMDVRFALIPPLAYFVYGLARGAVDGWYPYWFMDPAKQSVAQLLGMAAMQLGVYAVLAAVLIAVDRWLGRKNPHIAKPAQ